VPEVEIPQSVRAFIDQRIGSIFQLEVLLLLHRNPGRDFTAEDVAHELRIEPSWAALCLAQLQAGGLLVAAEGPPLRYHYGPRTADLDDTTNQLARVYSTHRVSITAMIFSKPPDPLKSFADAFRLRKDTLNG